MTVTKTTLKVMDDEVVCSFGAIESGVGYVFLGTNDGDIYKYAIVAGTLTRLANVGGTPVSLTMLYSGTLYIGLRGGDFVSLTTT